MMKKAMVLLMLLGVAGLFSGCDLDDGQNFHFTTLSVVDVTLPESFELNQTYDIEVTYVRPDACTFFEGFEVTRTGQTDRDVVVIGSVFTDQEVCAQVIQEVSATFEFQVIYSGEYHFRFFSGRDTNDNANFLEFTVPVVE